MRENNHNQDEELNYLLLHGRKDSCLQRGQSRSYTGSSCTKEESISSRGDSPLLPNTPGCVFAKPLVVLPEIRIELVDYTPESTIDDDAIRDDDGDDDDDDEDEDEGGLNDAQWPPNPKKFVLRPATFDFDFEKSWNCVKGRFDANPLAANDKMKSSNSFSKRKLNSDEEETDALGDGDDHKRQRRIVWQPSRPKEREPRESASLSLSTQAEAEAEDDGSARKSKDENYQWSPPLWTELPNYQDQTCHNYSRL